MPNDTKSEIRLSRIKKQDKTDTSFEQVGQLLALYIHTEISFHKCLDLVLPTITYSYVSMKVKKIDVV